MRIPADGPFEPSKDVRHQIRFILAANVISLIFALALLASHIVAERRSVLEQAQDTTGFVADLVAERTAKAVSDLRQLLIGIDTAVTWVAPSPNYDAIVRTVLLDYKKRAPYLQELGIANPHGDVTHWSGEGPMPYVRDRDYITAHFNATAPDLFLGEPLVSRVYPGQWFFGVSFAVRGRDKSLQRIIVAAVDIDYFRQLFEDIQLPDRGTLVLLSKEGRVITRIPDHQLFVGQRIGFFKGLERPRRGHMNKVSPFDNLQRIVGYKQVENANITAFTSVPVGEVLADWYKNAAMASLLGLLLVVFVGVTTYQAVLAQQQIALQRSRLERLAATDEMTGLYNRRHFLHAAASHIAASRRHGYPLSCLVLDIDRFKGINDTFGHEGGDQAIMAVTTAMREVLRAEDVPCRFGGDEFTVLLTGTDLEGARAIAERMCRRISEIALAQETGTLHVTVSIGAAEWDQREDTLSGCLRRADTALYEAKNQGRNQVCVAKSEG